MKNILIIFFLTALIVLNVNAQVGIGVVSPNPSAILHLQSSNKGFLPPIVNLTSNTMDLDGTPGQAEGLIVYNTSNNLPKGYYYWNGTTWRLMDSSSVVEPAISSIQCATVTLLPSSYTAGEPFTGIMTVVYSGGNGGSYDGGLQIPSTGVTGLTATLQAGKLNVGGGTLTFIVTGTPSASSPNEANFNLPTIFGATGCRLIVGYNQEIKTLAFTKRTVSPIPATQQATQDSTTTTFGNIRVRYFGGSFNGIQISTLVNSHISWWAEMTGSGTNNGSTTRYRQQNAVAGQWYNWETTFNPDNRDYGRILITLHNTNEIYRVTALANGNINTSPATPSRITFFIERLD